MSLRGSSKLAPSLAEPEFGIRDRIEIFLGLPPPRSGCCLPKGLAPSFTTQLGEQSLEHGQL